MVIKKSWFIFMLLCVLGVQSHMQYAKIPTISKVVMAQVKTPVLKHVSWIKKPAFRISALVALCAIGCGVTWCWYVTQDVRLIRTCEKYTQRFSPFLADGISPVDAVAKLFRDNTYSVRSIVNLYDELVHDLKNASTILNDMSGQLASHVQRRQKTWAGNALKYGSRKQKLEQYAQSALFAAENLEKNKAILKAAHDALGTSRIQFICELIKKTVPEAIQMPEQSQLFINRRCSACLLRIRKNKQQYPMHVYLYFLVDEINAVESMIKGTAEPEKQFLVELLNAYNICYGEAQMSEQYGREQMLVLKERELSLMQTGVMQTEEQIALKKESLEQKHAQAGTTPHMNPIKRAYRAVFFANRMKTFYGAVKNFVNDLKAA
ncbi:MAG: hypothetical protein UU47_C0007G0028 [candidate division TM6 bacterium GW2011_GWE2_41_16]|nr:MAG: hypothetical protein UU47_C0007G0028 [candidate division TM6 bacterium GW2011_GWE2_41_16]